MKKSAASAENLELSGLQLAEGEVVVAVFRPDLNAARRFSEGLVVVTSARVWFRDEQARGAELPRDAAIEIERREHAGVCELLLKSTRGSARFRYTLARAREAAELADALGRAPSELPRERAPSDPDDEPAAPAPVGSPLLRLFSFAKPRLPTVLVGFGLTLATTCVGLIPPYLTMPLVDDVLVPWQARATTGTDAAARTLLLYLGGLGLAAVVAWLLAWAQGVVLARVSEVISADLRNRAFSHLTRLSIRYFGGKRTGDLISRISSETDRLCSFLSDTLIDFITDVLMIVGTSVVLFTLDPLLATAALVSFPPIAWFMLRVRGSLTHGFLRGGRVWSQMTNILADTIPGIRVVKAFSQERREIRRFEQANQRIVEVNNRVNALWTSFWPLVALLNQIGLLVVWAVGAHQVLHHRITVGVLTAFIAYIGRFYGRVESMSRMLTLTQRASAAAQRLFEILDRAPNLPAATNGADSAALAGVKGDLEFERVSFRYGSRLVLDNVSFRVAPGELLGIVGHTGSGKSTVANLVCRFYEASDGAVRLDGRDVRSFAVEDYRRQIGVVLQESFLFFGTIAENVAYGLPEAKPAAVLSAARAARAHEFVLKLPEGYDSLVGERGQSLSGGERQRVAIARAILINPRILVLDEATSAVDVQTEREIQQALDNVVAGRTTIAIAHRLSTLAKADRLLVLKDGKLVETGTHADLLARGGEYARLQRAQALAAPASVGDDLPVDSAAAPPPPSAPASGGVLELLWSAEDDTLRVSCVDGSLAVVSARRCFPLTDPERFISLVDAQGRELSCIENPAALTPESRAALQSALVATELLPQVERIEWVREEATSSTWRVFTDLGEREFMVEQEDHIRRLSDGRHLITDSFGMRYLVPRPEQLDPKSRRLLFAFLLKGVLEFLLVEEYRTLISGASLASALGDPELRLVDCRASLQDPSAGRHAYRQQHLPRAVFADLLEDLSGSIIPGKTGRHPLPELPRFVERLRGWGIGAASQVVAYDEGSGAFAARLWWLLRWLGHERVALLDGGFAAWLAHDLPVTTEATLVAAGDFSPQPRPEMVVTAAELLSSSAGKLFDARAPERFRGEVEPIDPVAGHIPGAENLPFADNSVAGAFRSAAELRARFDAALSGGAPEQAVVYCGSGVTACHHVLAFAHAGLPLPRLYAGSWSEWITDPSRPIAKG